MVAVKISSLQRFWIKRSFDENFHDWKILLLHIIYKSFGKKFVFHSNVKVNKRLANRNTIEKFLTPGVVNFHGKHWYQLQFYLSFYGLTVKSK